MFFDRLAVFRPNALSLMRAVTAFCFCLHGLQKILGPLGGHLGKGSAAPFFSMMGLAGVLETFGGLLLLAGLYTRPVAFLLSGQMAFAYFTRHAPQGFFPIRNGGELAAVYCFVFLYLATAGGGDWSLDHWVRKKK